MQISAIITFAATLGAVASFELGITREDRIALTEACEVLDNFDPSSLEQRSIEKRCNFDGCDDCSNNFVSCVQCLNGNNAPACVVCLSYCAAECGC